jgi:hypothetical protein
MTANISCFQSALNFFLNRILIHSRCSQIFELFHAFKEMITNLYITTSSCILVSIHDHALGFNNMYYITPVNFPTFVTYNLVTSRSLHPSFTFTLTYLPLEIVYRLSTSFFWKLPFFYLDPELDSSYFTFSNFNPTFCFHLTLCFLSSMLPSSPVIFPLCHLASLLQSLLFFSYSLNRQSLLLYLQTLQIFASVNYTFIYLPLLVKRDT